MSTSFVSNNSQLLWFIFALRNRRNPRRAVRTKEHHEDREASFSPRVLCASSFSACCFIRRVHVSRSHARVPFTRQTGLRFLRATASRRMLIFAIHTAWEPSLTYIIIRMSWLRLKICARTRRARVTRETVSGLFNADAKSHWNISRKKITAAKLPDAFFRWPLFANWITLLPFSVLNRRSVNIYYTKTQLLR